MQEIWNKTLIGVNKFARARGAEGTLVKMQLAEVISFLTKACEEGILKYVKEKPKAKKQTAKRPRIQNKSFFNHAEEEARVFMVVEFITAFELRIPDLLTTYIYNENLTFKPGQSVIEEEQQLPPNSRFRVAGFIAHRILGEPGMRFRLLPEGVPHEEVHEADSVDEPQRDPFVYESDFSSSFSESVQWHIDHTANLIQAHKVWLLQLKTKSKEDLYESFMPDLLKSVIPVDHASGYRVCIQNVIHKTEGNQIGKVFQFLYDVNQPNFIQALFPEPSVRESTGLFTTTMMAWALRGFIESRDSKDQERILKALEEQWKHFVEPRLKEFLPDLQYSTSAAHTGAEKTGSSSGHAPAIDRSTSVIDFHQGAGMQGHRLSLWPCIFPRLLDFLEYGHFKEKSEESDIASTSGQAPHRHGKGHGLHGHVHEESQSHVREEGQGSLKGGAKKRGRDEEPHEASRAPGPTKVRWQMLWCGSVQTDGGRFLMQFLHSQQRTRYTSPTAIKDGYTPCPYAFDNVLSVGIFVAFISSHAL